MLHNSFGEMWRSNTPIEHLAKRPYGKVLLYHIVDEPYNDLATVLHSSRIA